MREAAKAVGRAVAAAAGAWPVALAGIALVATIVTMLRRRRSRRSRAPRLRGAALAFAELERAMAARGHPRAAHETAREFARSARPHLGDAERADAELVVRLFELDRFSGEPLGDDATDRALDAASRLAAAGSGRATASRRPR